MKVTPEDLDRLILEHVSLRTLIESDGLTSDLADLTVLNVLGICIYKLQHLKASLFEEEEK